MRYTHYLSWVHLIWSRESNISASAPTPSTPSSATGFLIKYQAPDNSPLRRRDVERFPTLDGQSTSACIHSPLFKLNPAGQLSVVNAGPSMIYSTSPGKIAAPFAPSSNVGNVSTTWQLAAGILSWKNSLFSEGTASLCTDPAGAIQAYFLEPIPVDCTPIILLQASGQYTHSSDCNLAPLTIYSIHLPRVFPGQSKRPTCPLYPFFCP